MKAWTGTRKENKQARRTAGRDGFDYSVNVILDMSLQVLDTDGKLSIDDLRRYSRSYCQRARELSDFFMSCRDDDRQAPRNLLIEEWGLEKTNRIVADKTTEEVEARLKEKYEKKNVDFYTGRYISETMLNIVWILYKQFGYTEDEITAFCRKFLPQLKEIQEYYYAGDDDETASACRALLMINHGKDVYDYIVGNTDELPNDDDSEE